MFLYLKFWVPSWIHHAWSLWYFSLACGHCPKPRWEWMNKSLGLSGKFQWVDICLWAAVDRDFLAQLPHKTIRKNIRISTHLAVLSCPKHHLLFSCLRLRISCLWFIYCMLFPFGFYLWRRMLLNCSKLVEEMEHVAILLENDQGVCLINLLLVTQPTKADLPNAPLTPSNLQKPFKGNKKVIGNKHGQRMLDRCCIHVSTYIFSPHYLQPAYSWIPIVKCFPR